MWIRMCFMGASMSNCSPNHITNIWNSLSRNPTTVIPTSNPNSKTRGNSILNLNSNTPSNRKSTMKQ